MQLQKNTVYEGYVFLSRNQDSSESIDHCATALKHLASTCEFGAFQELLIRDRIVFGIQDSSVREGLPGDANLTLGTVIEKVRLSVLTQIQLEQNKAEKSTDESISAIDAERPPEKLPSRVNQPHYRLQILWQKTSKEQEPLPSLWFKVPEVWSFKPFCKQDNKDNKVNKTTKNWQTIPSGGIEDDMEDEFAIDMVTHKIG